MLQAAGSVEVITDSDLDIFGMLSQILCAESR